MAVIKPIEMVKVFSFCDFCEKFNIISDKIAGNDGFDEDLIEEELQKRKNENWLISFVDDRNDEYFLLHKLKIVDKIIIDN